MYDIYISMDLTTLTLCFKLQVFYINSDNEKTGGGEASPA